MQWSVTKFWVQKPHFLICIQVLTDKTENVKLIPEINKCSLRRSTLSTSQSCSEQFIGKYAGVPLHILWASSKNPLFKKMHFIYNWSISSEFRIAIPFEIKKTKSRCMYEGVYIWAKHLNTHLRQRRWKTPFDCSISHQHL